jgi:hypothetical protein
MNKYLTNEEILATLREFQDSGRKRESMTYPEHREENKLVKDMLTKMGGGMHPYSGPEISSMAQGMGRGVNTQGNRPISDGSDSKYRDDRHTQPQPWINDIDIRNNIYSPMDPLFPYGPPTVNRPREWDYPTSYNMNYIPQRIELMDMLRGMRKSWGILATIVETCKDQLLRLPWTIQMKDRPRGSSKAIEELRKFFRHPDGKLTFSQWARKLLDDVLVIDAGTIYINKRLDGKPFSLEILDGATIFPLIDDAGRRPDSVYNMSENGIVYEKRQPAFQQIIKGMPLINLSEDEIMYQIVRPTPEIPVLGFSPINQLFIEATEAIRKTIYQSEFWRAGSIPELMITVPTEWTLNQIVQFQAHFDSLMSGNLNLKSKTRFIPNGMKPFEIKNADGKSLWSDRDEMLIRLACYAFSISPTPFVKQVNRGTASSAQQVSQEEGLFSRMDFWKNDIMDMIIQEKFGYDDVEFAFLPRPESDGEKQSKIHQVQLQLGLRTLNEVRGELGEEPTEFGDEQLIYTGNGALRLKDIIEGNVTMPGAQGSEGISDAPKKEPAPIKEQPLKGPAKPAGTSTLPPTKVHKMIETLVKAEIDKRDIKEAAKEARKPTKGQREVGNFKKGHIWIQGLDITIENAKGSKRRVKLDTGEHIKIKMPAVYGYIKGYLGADDEHMDVYLGKHPDEDIVYVVDQNLVNSSGKVLHFDEHKCFIGFRDSDKVKKNYLKAHDDDLGADRFSAMTKLTMDQFKNWLKTGDMKKPISEQGVGEII